LDYDENVFSDFFCSPAEQEIEYATSPKFKAKNSEEIGKNWMSQDSWKNFLNSLTDS
jgi:hypothetical protein